ISVNDTALARGYVGLRTERDATSDTIAGDANNGDKSATYETQVRKYVIEDPNATYVAKMALGAAATTTYDNLQDDGGTLGTQRTDQVLSDDEIMQLALRSGINVDLYNTTF